MANVKVFNMQGAAVGEIALSDEVFGVEPHIPAMHAVVRAYMNAQRQGTQSALTRTEVRGGGRKIYRQKGTGNARHHGRRAPQFTHGGVVFAPKPRSYRYSLNRKLRRLALKSVLSDKAANGNVAVVDNLEVAEPKTKTMVTLLDAIDAGKSVVITNGVKANVVLSSRNIPGVVTTPADNLSVYDLVNAKTLVIDKAALATIEEVYA